MLAFSSHHLRLPSFIARGAMALMVLVSGCSLAPLDISEKACPCASGWTCDTPANRCVRELASDPGTTCAVRTDHRLWCTNKATKMYAGADGATAVVDELKTTYSWFECWTTGVRHAGGNTTWYRTTGDVNGV